MAIGSFYSLERDGQAGRLVFCLFKFNFHACFEFSLPFGSKTFFCDGGDSTCVATSHFRRSKSETHA